MSRYATYDEAVEQLRKLAHDLPISAARCLEASGTLKTALSEESASLGRLTQEIIATADSIDTAILAQTDAIEVIRTRALKLADKIESYLQAHPQAESTAPSGGSAAGSSAAAVPPACTAVDSARSFLERNAMTDRNVAGQHLDGWLPEMAAGMQAAFSKAFELFPDMYLGYVGTAETGSELVAQETARQLAAKEADRYPGSGNPDLDRMFSSPTSAMEQDRIQAEVSHSYRGMWYPARQVGTAEGAASWIAGFRDFGLLPNGSDNPTGLFALEIGHALASVNIISTDYTLRTAYRNFCSNTETQADVLSTGASADLTCFLAASWAEYCGSEHPRPVAVWVSERMISLVGRKSDGDADPWSSNGGRYQKPEIEVKELVDEKHKIR